MHRSFHVLPMAFAAMLFSMPAQAHQIDGQWCGPDGKTITINGPKIITPSGKQIEGSYARNRFMYTGPDDDPEMDQDIFLYMQNNGLMQVIRSTDPDKMEQWERCLLIS